MKSNKSFYMRIISEAVVTQGHKRANTTLTRQLLVRFPYEGIKYWHRAATYHAISQELRGERQAKCLTYLTMCVIYRNIL